MGNDYKSEARKQYLHYFRIWFIVIGALAGLCLMLGIVKAIGSNSARTNNEAPAERVYDNADVLTDAQEESLRDYIAEAEEKLQMDIVLVTINQSVEGAEAQAKYGYRSADWEQNMQDIADDFWDENKYGYNQGFEGDGVLLLSNWYQGQGGEHLSTSGKAWQEFSNYDIDYVLDSLGYYIESNPYKAYTAYVDAVCVVMGEEPTLPFSWAAVLLVPTITALIYAVYHLHQKAAKDTTTARTYVEGGKPVFRVKSDTLVRKSVSRRRIQTNNGGGGGRSGGGFSGGGGSHRSSGGARHGGGSRRR